MSSLTIDKAQALKTVLDRLDFRPNASHKIHCPSPLHDDSTPSCHVYDEKIKCFSCGIQWDAADLLEHTGGAVDKADAFRQLGWLAEGSLLPKSKPKPPQKKRVVDDAAKGKRPSDIWQAAAPSHIPDAGDIPDWYLKKITTTKPRHDFAGDNIRVISADDFSRIAGKNLATELAGGHGSLIVARATAIAKGAPPLSSVQVIGKGGKRTFGTQTANDTVAVFTVGDMDSKNITVCEGVGDALALSIGMDDGAVICTFGATMLGTTDQDGAVKIGAVRTTIDTIEASCARRWTLAPDADTAGSVWARALYRYILALTDRAPTIRASAQGLDPASVLTGEVSEALPSYPHIKTATELLRQPLPEGWQLPFTFFRQDGERVHVKAPHDGIVMVAGRPSGGKTELLTAITHKRLTDTAQENAPFQPPSAVIVSLDQSPHVMAHHLDRYGQSIDFDRILMTTVDTAKASTHIDALLSVAATTPICLCAWDYLQLLSADMKDGYGGQRHLEIAQIITHMRSVARTTHIPQVLAVQTSRAPSRSEIQRKEIENAMSIKNLISAVSSKRPTMESIKDGGSEQGADVILGIQNLGIDIGGNVEPSSDLKKKIGFYFVVSVLKDRMSHTAGAVAVLRRDISTHALVDAINANPNANAEGKAVPDDLPAHY